MAESDSKSEEEALDLKTDILPNENRDGDMEFEMLMLDGLVEYSVSTFQYTRTDFMSRTWILRRVVWTAKHIFISKLRDEFVIDSIPLAEAEKISASSMVGHSESFTSAVESMESGKQSLTVDRKQSTLSKHTQSFANLGSALMRKGAQNAANDTNEDQSKAILQINTIQDGSNSGCIMFSDYLDFQSNLSSFA